MSHGQAGGQDQQAVGDGQLGHGAVEQAHLHQGQEADDQPVQALGAGDDLQDHALGELGGVLGQQAGARLTGDAGALGGAHTGQAGGQSRAQEAKERARVLGQKFTESSCYCSSLISTYFVAMFRGRQGRPPS